MMERLWKEWGGGFAMIRLSESVESRRGRLNVVSVKLRVIAEGSSFSVDVIPKPSS